MALHILKDPDCSYLMSRGKSGESAEAHGAKETVERRMKRSLESAGGGQKYTLRREMRGDG